VSFRLTGIAYHSSYVVLHCENNEQELPLNLIVAVLLVALNTVVVGCEMRI
jgi:hypothetical protein